MRTMVIRAGAVAAALTLGILGWGAPGSAAPTPASSGATAAVPAAVFSTAQSTTVDARLEVVVRDGRPQPGQRQGHGIRSETAAYVLLGGYRIPVTADQIGTTRAGPVRIRVSGAGARRSSTQVAALLRSGAARITRIDPTTAARDRRATLGEHPVKIVPVYWSGSAPAIKPASIEASMEYSTRFWSDNTDGQLSFDLVKIYPATKISMSATEVANCDNWAAQDRVQRAYPELQSSPTDHVVIVLPSMATCWWGGYALFDDGMVWINGDMPGFLYAHEFGHNLGLGHGGSRTCYDSQRHTRIVTFSAYCTGMTYDDPWDIMGARAYGHLATANSWRIGAIPDSARTFVDRTRTVTLAPVAADSGIRSVVFEVAGRTFEMEYRIPTGWDEWIDSVTFLHSDGNRYTMPGGGVIVRYLDGDSYFGEKQEINFHPDGASYQYDRHPGMSAGERYTFPGNAMTISVESTSAAGAQVRFTLGETAGITRWYGADRYATSATISRYGFYAPTGTVHVASGSIFTDALSGAGVAAMAPGPLFLIKRDTLTDPVADELYRLDAFDSTIFGGPASIAPFMDEVLGISGDVTRYAGADRYETSAAISRGAFEPGVEVAYVASGQVFPDALSGAPVAGMRKAPMLLTGASALPPSIAAELQRLRPASVVVLGGPASIGGDVLQQIQDAAGVAPSRVAGDDRYVVSAQISKRNFAAGQDLVFVTSGEIFTDALSGAPVAGARRAPLLLVKGHSIPSAVASELKRLKPAGIVILGGPASVSPGVAASLTQFLAR